MLSRKNFLVSCFSILAVVLAANSVSATPRITEILLDTTVATDYYLVVLDPIGDGRGIWIDPGSNSGNSTTDPTGHAATAGKQAAPASMHGMGTGYGQLILSLASSDIAMLTTELGGLGTNFPTNANPTMFGSPTGPVNQDNIELARAGIPAGTSVTFTVDMNGEQPHLVAIMSGSTPTVTYNAATGTLTVQITTFGTTTNAGYDFTSISGFSIMTDTSFGTTPMRIIASTNAWVGDIYPLLPGMDDSAAVANLGGTVGASDAKAGITIYGPTGQTRDVFLFVPDSTMTTVYGAGTTGSDLTAFVNSDVAGGPTVDTLATMFGQSGTSAAFTYTFASPKDATSGLASPVDVVDGLGPEGTPKEYVLAQNYPNPFNPLTQISFSLAARSQVKLEIYNIAGQKVTTLIDRVIGVGRHSVIWHATNQASGVYLYKLTANDFVETKMMVLLK